MKNGQRARRRPQRPRGRTVRRVSRRRGVRLREKRSGPGGLPLGTQRPVVALISGGIDSPVAAWKLMKRGAPVIPVYVDLGDYGGPDHRARAVSTVNALASTRPGTTAATSLRPVTSSPTSRKPRVAPMPFSAGSCSQSLRLSRTTTTLSASSPAKLFGRNPARRARTSQSPMPQPHSPCPVEPHRRSGPSCANHRDLRRLDARRRLRARRAEFPRDERLAVGRRGRGTRRPVRPRGRGRPQRPSSSPDS